MSDAGGCARSEESLLASAIGPHDRYCAGYHGQGGYLIAVTLGIGVVPATCGHPGSDGLDEILAYDHAESADAYLGQINMTPVSSFCGVEGLIWGYDLARAPLDELPLATWERRGDLDGVSVRSASGLRAAARTLLGTVDDRRFPFLPGSHVPCAGKFRSFRGPARVYAAVAIGIPAERDRAACALMEDVGQLAPEHAVPQQQHGVLLNMARSVVAVGRNQRVEYREILVDCVSTEVRPGEIGCPLVAIPYFHLAGGAYLRDLGEMDLAMWIERAA